MYVALCAVRYRWTKDGERFVPPRASTTKTQHADGTFVLHNKQFIQFQGVYRCYAFNKLGTAMSEDIQLIVPSKESSSVVLKSFFLSAVDVNFQELLCLFLISCPQVSEGGRTPHCCGRGRPSHVKLQSSKRGGPTAALLDVPR